MMRRSVGGVMAGVAAAGVVAACVLIQSSPAEVSAAATAAAAAAPPAKAASAPPAKTPPAALAVQGTSSAPIDSTAIQKDIDAGNANFMRAWMTGDADLFASCFTEDGAMLRPGGRIISGREGIRTRMESVFQQFRAVNAVATTQDLFFTDDRAYETGKWVVTAGPVGKPSAAEPDSGHYVQIWKREGATWKLWRNINVE